MVADGIQATETRAATDAMRQLRSPLLRTHQDRCDFDRAARSRPVALPHPDRLGAYTDRYEVPRAQRFPKALLRLCAATNPFATGGPARRQTLRQKRGRLHSRLRYVGCQVNLGGSLPVREFSQGYSGHLI